MVWAALSFTTFATTCYGVDGSQMDDTIQPCYPNGTGPCCSVADECLSNGMCFGLGTYNVLLQGACTDSSFEAPGCLKICSKFYPTVSCIFYYYGGI